MTDAVSGSSPSLAIISSGSAFPSLRARPLWCVTFQVDGHCYDTYGKNTSGLHSLMRLNAGSCCARSGGIDQTAQSQGGRIQQIRRGIHILKLTS
jgi:hypothetical protein